MNKKIITGVALFSMIAGLAQAANIRYKANGDWFDTTDATGDSNGWQGTALPGTADTARANWGGNTVTLSGIAPTINKFELGVNESGEFHIMNGGQLTTLADSRIGNNQNGDADTGTLTIDAGGTVTVGGWLGLGHGTFGNATVEGTLNANSHLWMGATGNAQSIGTLTINNGGIVNVGGQIGLGTINASSASGGTGTVTVASGGLLSLHHWNDTESIQNGSVINVNGTGVVTVGGNRVDAANDYFTAGKIASDQGAILATFDSDANVTTVVAIPEPATLGLLAVFGGGMVFLRRRFKR